MEKGIEKNIGIEILKTLALCGVLALHTQRSYFLHECWNPLIYYLARFCMPIFFMVNGALIMKRDTFSFSYYKRKVLNIIRILTIWAIITFVYSYLLLDLTFHISLINGIKSLLGGFIVPFWFLFTFILIYTILLFCFDFIKKHLKWVVYSLFFICILIDVVSLTNIGRGGYFLQASIPQKFRLWTWLFYFLFGYYLSSLAPYRKRLVAICLVVFTILSWIYQYYLCFEYLEKMNSEYTYDNVLIIIWCACIFVSFCNLKFIDQSIKKAITVVSSNMFGVFLLHGFFIKYFGLTEIVRNGIESSLLFVILLIGCWGISFIINHIPYLKEIIRY